MQHRELNGTFVETVNTMCALFVKWKIKFQQGEHCAPSQTTVALGASSVMQGQGPRVKVHLSIEPSAGGGERWACRRPIEPARAFRQPKPMLLSAATFGGRDFIVLTLNCGGTSETKKSTI